MTESIVPDKNFNGLWHVYVDGFFIGELFADEVDEWPVNYYFVYCQYLSSPYASLADAEKALMQTYRSTVKA